MQREGRIKTLRIQIQNLQIDSTMTRLDQAPDFTDNEMEAKARERVPEI